MSDLIKRMGATIGMGVISKGSTSHEYSIAELQFREAKSALEAKDQEIEQLDERWGAAQGIIESQASQIQDLQARVAELEAKINGAVNVGHNDDSMFCGFKDRALTSGVVLRGWQYSGC